MTWWEPALSALLQRELRTQWREITGALAAAEVGSAPEVTMRSALVSCTLPLAGLLFICGCATGGGAETKDASRPGARFDAGGCFGTMCGEECVDLEKDVAHCGGCDLACDAGEECIDGACGSASCPEGTALCGAACVDLMTDASSCGACGTACAAGETCTGGSCAEGCPAPSMLCPGEDGSTVCTDVSAAPSSCGACGTACAPGESCVGGACTCVAPDQVCGGACTDVMTSQQHCGACGNACGPEQICVDGACACPTGFMLCAGACTNVRIDDRNCGACGSSCATPAESCSDGICTASCGAGMVVCGGRCTDTATSATDCGGCGNSCASGTTCRGGVCAPSNDERTSAITITLGSSEVVVSGTTAGATNDGPSVPCSCTSGANVWYRFTLGQRSVVYFDTAGSSFDTALFLTDSSGTPVPAQSAAGFGSLGLCNDDANCSGAEWTSIRQSRTAGVLAAGTYYVAVGGCGSGAFTLRGQMIPDDVGRYFYASRLQGDGTTSTHLVGESVTQGTCGGAGSGEDVRWFLTCGGQAQLFSLCSSDGGTFERREGTTSYDPTLYLRSARTGAQVACNDDGGSMGGTSCAGTAPTPSQSSDSFQYGSRLNDVTAPRGINALFVDERGTAGGMSYTLRYIVR